MSSNVYPFRISRRATITSWMMSSVPMIPAPENAKYVPAEPTPTVCPPTAEASSTIVEICAFRTKERTIGGARRSRPRTSSAIRAISSPVCTRAAGFFCRQRSMTSASRAGTSGRIPARRGAGCETCCTRMAGTLAASNGGRPVSAKNIVAASE